MCFKYLFTIINLFNKKLPQKQLNKNTNTAINNRGGSILIVEYLDKAMRYFQNRAWIILKLLL